jgi:hypothetical protein
MDTKKLKAEKAAKRKLMQKEIQQKKAAVIEKHKVDK